MKARFTEARARYLVGVHGEAGAAVVPLDVGGGHQLRHVARRPTTLGPHHRVQRTKQGADIRLFAFRLEYLHFSNVFLIYNTKFSNTVSFAYFEG